MKILPAFLLLALLFWTVPAPAAAQHTGPAIVQDDASLVIGSRRYVLADIILLPTGQTCETRILPARCASHAVLALRRKVQHFVACTRRYDLPQENAAVCRHNPLGPEAGDDLGAFLIAEGWAVAAAEAPPLYHALELLARSHGRGAWGTSVDELVRPDND